MTSEKIVNWTQEQTAELVNAYAVEKDTAKLAELFSRSQRSIVAKLVTEKVYQKAETAKTKITTKAGLLVEVEDALGLDRGVLASLDKGSKESLQALHEVVTKHLALGDSSAWLSSKTE